MNYLIEDVKYGMTEEHYACGPIGANLVASIKINDGVKSFWLNNVDVAGIPNFYLTEKDIFNELIKENFDDEDTWDYIGKSSVKEFNGITLGEYEDVFDSIKKSNDKSTINLIRLLIYITRSDCECKLLVKKFKGKKIDDIEVEASNVEEDYLEERIYFDF